MSQQMWRKYHRKNSKWNTTRTKKRNRGQGKWAYQEVWRWYITSIDEKGYQKINDQLNFVQQKLTQLNQDEETYQEISP